MTYLQEFLIWCITQFQVDDWGNTENFPTYRSIAQNFLQADAQIDGLVHDLAVVPYIEYHAVHPNDEIDRDQRPVLPLLDCLAYLVRNDGDGRCGKLYFINLAHLLLYVGTPKLLVYKKKTSFSMKNPGLSCLGTAIDSNWPLWSRGIDLTDSPCSV